MFNLDSMLQRIRLARSGVLKLTLNIAAIRSDDDAALLFCSRSGNRAFEAILDELMDFAADYVTNLPRSSDLKRKEAW